MLYLWVCTLCRSPLRWSAKLMCFTTIISSIFLFRFGKSVPQFLLHWDVSAVRFSCRSSSRERTTGSCPYSGRAALRTSPSGSSTPPAPTAAASWSSGAAASPACGGRKSRVSFGRTAAGQDDHALLFWRVHCSFVILHFTKLHR